MHDLPHIASRLMASKSLHGRQLEQTDLAEGISRLKFLILGFRLTCGAASTVYTVIYTYTSTLREWFGKAHVKVET